MFSKDAPSVQSTKLIILVKVKFPVFLSFEYDFQIRNKFVQFCLHVTPSKSLNSLVGV